jgi:hypothetical protein
MKYILVLCIGFIYQSAVAQSQTGLTTYNKIQQSSVFVDLPYSDEAAANALENRMIAFGKPKKVKDFIAYRNIQVPELSNDPISLYFNVERKSRKDNSNATITMLMANSADQFYRMDEKPELFVKGRQFLDSMNAPVAAAGLELQINAQDETVIKADKRLKKLRDDAIEFEKQKKRLEEKIAENVKDIEKQEKELAEQKIQLETLIKQRKN